MINQAGSYRAIKNLQHLLDSEEARRVVSEIAVQTEEHRAASPSELNELDAPLRSQVASVLALLEGDRFIHMLMELEGALRFDTIGLHYLETLGSYGQDLAARMRPSAQSRWAATTRMDRDRETEKWIWWCESVDEHAHFPIHLARVIWRDVLGKLKAQAPASSGSGATAKPAKQGVEKTSAPKYPALSATVVRRCIDAFFVRVPVLKTFGGELRLVNGRNEVVAVVAPDIGADTVTIMKMVESTRSLLGHRFFAYIVQSGVELTAGSKDARRRALEVQGGLRGLATELGVTSSSAATDLKQVLGAWQHLKLQLPDGETRSLVTWSIVPACPGRRAVLRIVLDDALLPNYTEGLLKNTRAKREAKRLVPVSAVLPPLGGHVHTHAAQALFQVLLFDELSVYAEDLFTTGFVRIPWARWWELAQEAGLGGDDLTRTWTAWIVDETRILNRHNADGDLYAVADSRSTERQLLLLRGERSAKGRAYRARAKTF